MDCVSRAAKFNVSSTACSFHISSNFVAQMLDGSGFETPTHNVESENAWTLHPDQVFAAGSLSNVILDQRNVFQSGKVFMLYASLRSISGLHLSLHGLD